MLDRIGSLVGQVTQLGLGLLTLAIVVSLLVGPANMAFFGDVVGNITALVKELGSNGLAGLVAVGVVLWLFNRA